MEFQDDFVSTVVPLLTSRCAGLCEYRTGGCCTIKLSEKLLKFRPRKDLIATLLVGPI